MRKSSSCSHGYENACHGGLEATRKIREFNNRIPIIALTANAFDADRISALDAGCNEFLAKPLKKSQLLELFSKKW